MNFYSNLLCAINLLSKQIDQIIKRKKVENIEAAKLLAVSNPMPPIFEDQQQFVFQKKIILIYGVELNGIIFSLV